MLPRIDKSLGKNFPKDGEDLLLYNNRILAPIVAELLRNWNGLDARLAAHIEADAATISTIDTTDYEPFCLMIDSALGDVYSLDKTGVPGAGDLAASPTGAWLYEYSL